MAFCWESNTCHLVTVHAHLCATVGSLRMSYVHKKCLAGYELIFPSISLPATCHLIFHFLHLIPVSLFLLYIYICIYIYIYTYKREIIIDWERETGKIKENEYIYRKSSHVNLNFAGCSVLTDLNKIILYTHTKLYIFTKPFTHESLKEMFFLSGS